MKLSNAQRKRIVSALTPDLAAPQALSYRLGQDGAIDRVLLHIPAAMERVLAVRQILDWVAPSFPINGGALVARGVDKGPDVARLLKLVEHQWIAEDFPSAERANAIADAAVAQFLSDSSIA